MILATSATDPTCTTSAPSASFTNIKDTITAEQHDVSIDPAADPFRSINTEEHVEEASVTI